MLKPQLSKRLFIFAVYPELYTGPCLLFSNLSWSSWVKQACHCVDLVFGTNPELQTEYENWKTKQLQDYETALSLYWSS